MGYAFMADSGERFGGKHYLISGARGREKEQRSKG